MVEKIFNELKEYCGYDLPYMLVLLDDLIAKTTNELESEIIHIENEIEYIENKMKVCGYGKRELLELEDKKERLELLKGNGGE